MLWVLGGSYGAGRFLMGEVPLYNPPCRVDAPVFSRGVGGRLTPPKSKTQNQKPETQAGPS